MSSCPFSKTLLRKNHLSSPGNNNLLGKNRYHSRTVLHHQFHRCHQSWENRITVLDNHSLQQGSNLRLHHPNHSMLVIPQTLMSMISHHFHPFQLDQPRSITLPIWPSRMGTRELHPLYPSRRLNEEAAYNMIMMRPLHRIELLITPISSPGSTISAPLVLAHVKIIPHPSRRTFIKSDTPNKDLNLQQLVIISMHILQRTKIVLTDLRPNQTTNNIPHNHIRLQGTLLSNLRNNPNLMPQKICSPLRSRPHSLLNPRTLLHLQSHPTRRKTHYSPLFLRLLPNRSIQITLPTFQH